MSENVQSVMLDILKRIQADVSGLKTDVAELKTDVGDLKQRVIRLEDLAKKQRRDSAAMLVMMRGTVGVFTERMDALEIDVMTLKEAR